MIPVLRTALWLTPNLKLVAEAMKAPAEWLLMAESSRRLTVNMHADAYGGAWLVGRHSSCRVLLYFDTMKQAISTKSAWLAVGGP